MLTKVAKIGVTGDIGGRDAANRFVPIARKLKNAAQGIELDAFPVGDLIFVLNVDGEIHEFGFAGVGHLDLNVKEDFLSIGIGIPVCKHDDPEGFISTEIDKSFEYIRDILSEKFGTDGFQDGLRAGLDELLSKFSDHLIPQETSGRR